MPTITKSIEPSTPDLSDAAPVAVIEKPRGPIHTVVLPTHLVILDAEVRQDFLSDDLETICSIAARTASTLLITTAGQSLDQREVAFQVWRKRGLDNLANAVPHVREFLAKNEEVRVEFEAGTIDLLVLDRLLHDSLDEANKKRMDYLATSKQCLRDSVAKNTADNLDGKFPRYCIIRADGEMKLFRQRHTAIEFGREGNFGFHIVPFDGAKREFKPANYQGD